MTEDMKSTLDALRTEFSGAFKELNDRREAEIKAHGAETAETKAAMDRVQDQLDALEVKLEGLKAPRTTPDLDPSEVEGSRKAAFMDYLRTGAIDRKALMAGDDTDGGFLTPAEFVPEILRGITQISALRGLAEVRTTSARSIQRPKRTGLAVAQWIGDTATRVETQNPQLGMDEIPNHELYTRIVVSHADLEDNGFALEQFIQDEASEAFAVSEGAAFVGGNGVGKPLGFLTDTSIETVKSGNASNITADGLFDLTYALKTGYAPNAAYVMHRTTIREVRKLKDTTNNYIWQPEMAGLAEAAPATINGHRYVELPDMPTIAASANVITFGDFKRGYTIVDRVSVRILRDEYTAAATGQIVLHTYRRVGGQVRIPEALKTMYISA